MKRVYRDSDKAT